MSQLKVDNITDELGTGAPDFPTGISVDGESLLPHDQATLSAGTNTRSALVSPAGLAQTVRDRVISERSAAVSLSGASTSIIGIPSGVRRITFATVNASLTGTDSFLVQLGTSAGFVTSGYFSAGTFGTSGAATSSAGFIVIENVASRTNNIIMQITQFAGNLWVSTSQSAVSVGEVREGAGRVVIENPDRIRITATGANTLDSGTASIIWEY